MDQPIFFVRDSPFLKNDISRRTQSLPNSFTRRRIAKPSDALGSCSGFPMLRTSRSIEHHRGDGIVSTYAMTSPMNDSDSENGSEPDLEYGPGIVEKLREKFQRLSGIASRDAKVSPHATGKRCPSVDDILSTSGEEPSNRSISASGQSTMPYSSLSRLQSRSTGDMINTEAGSHPFTIHRSLPAEEQDDSKTATISDLRRKFEISSQRKPSYSLGYAKVGSWKNESLNDARPPLSTYIVPYSTASVSGNDFVSTREHSERISGKHVQAAEVAAFPYEDKRREQRIVGQSSATWRTFEARNDARTANYAKPFHVLEVLNRAGTTEVTNNNKEEVPEFIRIGRRLRRSSALSRKWEHGETRNDYQRTMDSSELYPHKIHRAFSPHFTGIPTLSSNARVVSDDFYEEPERHRFEISSPPDPDSARERTSHISDTESAVFVRTDVVSSAANASPPPEEPKPSLDVNVNDYTPAACTADNQLSDLPQTSPDRIIPRNNDEIGVIEMQRLLHKFQRARIERQLEAKPSTVVSSAALELPSNLPSAVPKRTFVHAVVGVRLSGLSTASDSQPINGTVSNKPNVVHISVRSDTPVLHAKQSNYEKIAPPPSSRPSVEQLYPSSPKPWPSTAPSEQPRKSLSAKFMEEKSSIMSPSVREEPRLDQTEELQSVPFHYDTISKTSTSSVSSHAEVPNQAMNHMFLKNSECNSDDSSDGELPQNEHQDTIDFGGETLAGDGNPVRHSLLSLVMEEDIPALMEAMNETFTCEFEDLGDQTPSTSSILHTPGKRKERRRARQVSSIRFEEASPKVYTYLDEVSAMVKKEWVEGVHVDYETYQKILAAEVEEYKSMMTGLQKWKEEMSTRSSEDSISQDSSEFEVDAPSSLPYSFPESNTMVA